jgi:hypothetical protein
MNTNILVSQVASDTQLTVLQNDMMDLFIIPFPNTDKESCIPVSMACFPDFFHRMESLFCSKTKNRPTNYDPTSEPYLYMRLTCFDDFSTVPTKLFTSGYDSTVYLQDSMYDIEQHKAFLSQKFGLPKVLSQMIERDYVTKDSNKYGFLVAIRNPACKSKPVPVAFLHPLVDSKLFVPSDQFCRKSIEKRTVTVYGLGSVSTELRGVHGERVNCKLDSLDVGYDCIDLHACIDSKRETFFPFPNMMYKSFIQKWNVVFNDEDECNIHMATHSSLSNLDKCTSTLTGNIPHIQEMYICKDCRITENGICRQCKDSCHRTHNTVFIGVVSEYCYCPQVKKCNITNVHVRTPPEFQ